MNYLTIISIGLALAVGLGTAFGIAYAYFSKNKTSSSVEVINLLQKEVEVYRTTLHQKEETHAKEVKEIRDDFTKQVTSLNKEFGILQGQYNSMKEQKETFEAIVKDKNPEMRDFMQSMAGTQKEILKLLIDIHTLAKAEQDREIKVDTHSVVTKS